MIDSPLLIADITEHSHNQERATETTHYASLSTLSPSQTLNADETPYFLPPSQAPLNSGLDATSLSVPVRMPTLPESRSSADNVSEFSSSRLPSHPLLLHLAEVFLPCSDTDSEGLSGALGCLRSDCHLV